MPAVLLDRPRLDANLHRFHRAAAVAGLQVRAHLKAHRTIELARRQVEAGAVGVAVQTAHAARRLAAAGVPDVILAWPWPPAKWRFRTYVETAMSVPGFAVHVAAAESMTGVGEAAVAAGTEVAVRLDLRHVPAEALPGLARLADSTPGVRLAGVTGYCVTGTAADIQDRVGLGRRYARRVVEVAESIRADGIECPVVSVGGTPTAPGVFDVDGVTEICAGAYATFDGGLAQVGVCRPDQVALSVATDAADLLAGCSQPWAPQVDRLPAAPPHQDRLVPAHVCPFALTLLKRGVDITVVEDGRPVDTWRPFAAPDRE